MLKSVQNIHTSYECSKLVWQLFAFEKSQRNWIGICMNNQWTTFPYKKRPRCYVKSPTAQDVFRPIPGLINCTGVTGRWESNRYAHSKLKSTHEVTTHDTQIELMTCRHSIYMCEYITSITNHCHHGQLHHCNAVPLLTYSASAASPPRITSTVAWSDTDTILTRWDTNSWRKNTTDGNMSRSLHWLSLYTITYRSDQLWICM